jgi:hypothetical protein
MSNKRKINKLAKKYNVNVHYIDNYWKMVNDHPHFVSYWGSVEWLFQKANGKDCYLFRTYNGDGVRGFYQIN